MVRELLLQEAQRLEIAPDPQELAPGKRETEEDSLIRRLLEAEIETPEADRETCRRFYEQNQSRFRTPTLYEAAHIFFPAPPEDEAARASARERAEATIAELKDDPKRFDALARARSACSSASEGGRLGQVSRGQTTPEFESFLDALTPGQLCPVPAETPYGVHVVRLDARAEGSTLPFEAVEARIADYLQQQVWQRAVAQYISILAGRARIEGAEIDAATSPLVQ